jgi:hypothetical protein
MQRIVLTRSDFAELCAGKVVVQDGVEIALGDIGMDAMREAVHQRAPDYQSTYLNLLRIETLRGAGLYVLTRN